MNIHPTAVVDPAAELGAEVTVGAYVVIEQATQIGEGSTLAPFVVIHRYTSLGPRCHVHTGAVLGGLPQDSKFQGERSFLRLGADNEVREFVTLHRASGEDQATVIGDRNLLMAYSHIGHNCVVGNEVLIANSVGISGHCVIEDFVNIGGLIGMHQYVTVGLLAMVGGLSRIVRDVPPYTVVEGNPARPRGINLRGLQRQGVSENTRDALRRLFRLMFRSDLNISDAIEKFLEGESPPPAEAQYLIDFMRRMDQGYRGRQMNPP